jgi:hypothetical protein
MKTIRDYINIVEGRNLVEAELEEDLTLKDRRDFNALTKKKKKAEQDMTDLSRDEMERLYALKRRNKGFVAPDKKKG